MLPRRSALHLIVSYNTTLMRLTVQLGDRPVTQGGRPARARVAGDVATAPKTE